MSIPSPYQDERIHLADAVAEVFSTLYENIKISDPNTIHQFFAELSNSWSTRQSRGFTQMNLFNAVKDKITHFVVVFIVNL